jgi:phosphoribosylamine--glycine ligase
MAKILVLGSGGREHAIVWSLARENRHELICAPGNAGTAQLAQNVDLNLSGHVAVADFARQEGVDLTVVGPEVPLAEGIVDHFQAEGLKIFGPTKAAAQLVGSKLFARDFMRGMGIPHPDYRSCYSKEEASKAVEELGLPVVLKADGLAAGKGVIICQVADDVNAALEQYFDRQVFGQAGLALSVEECLSGPEMSVFALADGEHCVIMGTAQDYKRAYDGDAGPNTGGMGSIAPSALATEEFIAEVSDTILRPTLQGMKANGHPYVGFLYAGLMIVAGKPFVIEFNVRMGDPESQVVLPLMEAPLSELMERALSGDLPDSVATKPGAAVCVVLASEGYPGSYEKGKPITGLEGLDGDMIIYHAGTSLDEGGQLVSSGGRVLNVVGTGGTIPDAARKVYGNIPRIDFPGSFYRNDIGV